jgi:hypothetical protein
MAGHATPSIESGQGNAEEGQIRQEGKKHPRWALDEGAGYSTALTESPRNQRMSEINEGRHAY